MVVVEAECVTTLMRTPSFRKHARLFSLGFVHMGCTDECEDFCKTPHKWLDVFGNEPTADDVRWAEEEIWTN